AMEAFRLTGNAQMRLVSQFEIANHVLIVLLILGSSGLALWLWMQGQVGAGAVAAVTAMALRISGHARWVMWEMTSLFESVGTIQDGINTLTHPPTVLDAPQARPLQVARGEVVFDDVSFGYRDGKAVMEHLNLTIRPGERIGLIGRSGAGKSTLVNLLLRFHDLRSGRILIDGQVQQFATYRDAIAAGIGLFLALIALHNAGIVVSNPATMLGMGDLKQPAPILATLGFVLIVALEA
ncbi:MAG: ATP-binding cassette domain-containing protein, partial [Comamonas sp.]